MVQLAHVNDAAVAVFFGVFGHGINEEVEDLPSFVEGFAADVDGFEVAEHADEDLAFGDGAEESGVEAQIDVGCLFGECAEFGEAEDAAVAEGVEPVAGFAVFVGNDEVAGEADAVDVAAEAAGDFHVDQRERNGNAQAAHEDGIEAAIAGVVILLGVAAELHDIEEEFVGTFDEVLAVGGGGELGADLFG